ncbi:MAG: hypothetical protein BYD32DRAFT_426540, partial [Podila humilis]
TTETRFLCFVKSLMQVFIHIHDKFFHPRAQRHSHLCTLHHLHKFVVHLATNLLVSASVCKPRETVVTNLMEIVDNVYIFAVFVFKVFLEYRPACYISTICSNIYVMKINIADLKFIK